LGNGLVLNLITCVLTVMLYPVAFHQILVLDNQIIENNLTGLEAHFRLRVNKYKYTNLIFVIYFSQLTLYHAT